MAQFEKISLLDKEMDVQAALLEGIMDRVAYLEASVLELERTRAVRRSKPKSGRISLSVPQEPS